MNIFVAILALVGGFVLLIKGADWFVEGSSSVARLLKVPTIIIGLTVVALGTSLPEASVSISSAVAGKNAMAISNVVGSNIFNTLVVLGASALIMPVRVQKNSIEKEIPFSILCTVALLASLLFGVNTAVAAEGGEELTTYTLGRAGGAVLLALFAFYMYWQISAALKARRSGMLTNEADEGKSISPFRSVIYIVIGVASIIVGGKLVVESASEIASKLGMTETQIGMTVVALGTSLPELVTSMVAAKKGESDLALGNVIGSNIFNIIFILGFSPIISPITVDILAVIDTVAVIVISTMVLLFAAATKNKISRTEGGIMLACYAGYFAYTLMR